MNKKIIEELVKIRVDDTEELTNETNCDSLIYYCKVILLRKNLMTSKME